MKSFTSLIVFLLFASFSTAQELYQEAIAEDGTPFLLGPVSVSLLQQQPYDSWYNQNYEDYQPDSSYVSELQSALEKHHVLLFLGTWCGDSRREVPKFLKILDQAQFAKDRLKIVAVDRREPNVKQSPTGEQWGLQIKRVPTFIFLKDGKEVNRIVESPVESLEKDMLRILARKDYEPNYADLMRSE